MWKLNKTKTQRALWFLSQSRSFFLSLAYCAIDDTTNGVSETADIISYSFGLGASPMQGLFRAVPVIELESVSFKAWTLTHSQAISSGPIFFSFWKVGSEFKIKMLEDPMLKTLFLICRWPLAFSHGRARNQIFLSSHKSSPGQPQTSSFSNILT